MLIIDKTVQMLQISMPVKILMDIKKLTHYVQMAGQPEVFCVRSGFVAHP